MIPAYDNKGNLPPGIHPATWKEIEKRYGYNHERRKQLTGLKAALTNLKSAGCKMAYLDGSFITDKESPGGHNLNRPEKTAMIKNDLQYRVAKSTLKKLQATLEHHDKLTVDQAQWVRDAHKATIVGEIMKLQKSIDEYDALKNGDVEPPPLDLIGEIPSMLIKRRIALGWTQEDLAKRLDVRTQQVQDDEATNYESASLSRLLRIAEIMQKARGKRKKASAARESNERRFAT